MRPHAEAMKSPIHILHLEDDPEDAALIHSRLESEGVSCVAECVRSHDAFVSALERSDIDLVLSDSALPGFDGLTALKIVRARWPAIPLIFVSGMLGEERAVESLKKGATDYVLKDRLARLAPAVRRAIKEAEDFAERKRGEEELRASREELRALAARIQAAREEERTHAAREIHDVLAQELTSLNMEVGWLTRKLAEPMETWDQHTFREKAESMKSLTYQAAQSVRRIAWDLRPIVLDSLGLCAAVEWVAADFQKRSEIHCVAIVPGQGLPLDRNRSTAVFRILQESLANIVRHARATSVEINLWQEAGGVLMTVCDNGCGVQAAALKDPRSLGLLGMRERASLLGGRSMIRPREGGGTIVEVRIPIGPPEEIR
jgi:signal transduction histidine kinase